LRRNKGERRGRRADHDIKNQTVCFPIPPSGDVSLITNLGREKREEKRKTKTHKPTQYRIMLETKKKKGKGRKRRDAKTITFLGSKIPSRCSRLGGEKRKGRGMS